eukprot:TRINITY_DN65409_c0_g1_i1.p1 TRINITY_DN65409_c0_g1~~TRINITY_DN65409_c0_g1_i1.p1  ORF type:complete len:901 (+),score=109.13 TRINITY_DN65409_c0_g1_i1:69-2705(+)
MADPLSSLLQQKKPVANDSVAAAPPPTNSASSNNSSFFDVETSLGARPSLFGDPSEETIGERIYRALAPATNVDFPMITEICERAAKEPREATEAVRLLASAFSEARGPARRKLKALTIMNELMHDKRAAKELGDVRGAREALWSLQTTRDSGLGPSVDEQIRMFATEIERTCFGASGDPFSPIGNSSPSTSGGSQRGSAAQAPLQSVESFTGDPFAPIAAPGGAATSGDPFAPSFSSPATMSGSSDPFAPTFVNSDPSFSQPRKRDMAIDRLWQFGSAVGANLAAAGAAATANVQGGGLSSFLTTGSSANGWLVATPSPSERPRTNFSDSAALQLNFPDLLPGEKVYHAVKEGVLLTYSPFCETNGRLLVTNYRLRFQVPKGTLRDDLGWMMERQYLDVPMGTVEELKAEKRTSEAGALQMRARIVTKDFRNISILVESVSDLIVIEDAVAAFSQTGNLFAFSHAAALLASGAPRDEGKDAWGIYDPHAEYARMGVETPFASAPSCPWKVTDANVEYRICDSYPAWLVMPRGFAVQDIQAVASFRKRGRLPTLSWSAGEKGKFASVWRSSQTTEGFMGKTCPIDERLLKTLRESSDAGRSRAGGVLVVDLRQKKAAYANKFGAGGGFEAYDGCRLVFGDIDNVHGVRSAWKAMGAAVASLVDNEVGSWIRDVANSGWYDIMGAVMNCVRVVVDELSIHSCNALIHCSDGWDRTAQVASLVMLCMDPYYRTVRGLFVLIQKEFLSFGHRFRTRLAIGEKPSSEYSPIFLQWLECVYQLTLQFPTAFEFTPRLLLRIGKEALSNRYGTFLADCEKERAEKVAPYTLSLWPVLLDGAGDTMNPEYQPLDEPLRPSCCQIDFKVWEDYWFRFRVHPSSKRS